MKTKRLLILRLSALGDVAMTIPAIYSLALRYPDCKITVLTRPFFSRLFVNHPENISFILFEDEYQSFFGLLRLIRLLHTKKFDAVADFHNILRTWIISLSFLLTGTKVAMLGKDRRERRAILSKKVTQTTPFILRYKEVLEQLGFSIDPLITELPQTGRCLMADPNIPRDGKRWVGIAPIARYENKTYPLEQMREVVRLLAERDDTRIFIFGSKAERKHYEDWTEMGENISIVAGTMQLEQELALMRQLDVMVSMDSANQHMAALVGTRVVSIWGSTAPVCGFMAWNQGQTDAVVAGTDCQPCTIAGSKTCKKGTLECMKAIKPEEIVERIKHPSPALPTGGGGNKVTCD